VNPEIHADEFTAGNVTACFLANLADDGCFGRFAGLDVAAGLVQQNISPRVFFDEQITSIVFYDS
jgi:hypothetical protein